MTAAADIRHATPDDLELLADLGARLFVAAFGPDNTPEDMASYVATAFSVEQVAEELADPSAIFLLASVAGEIAGYAHLRVSPAPACVGGERPMELVRIYLDPEVIGKGRGRALMEACFDAAREDGRETLWLGVWERNQRAIGFYRRLGFEAVGSQEFLLGAEIQRDVVFERSLAADGD